MSRKLLIDSVCGRKRLAVIDNGVLCEMHYGTETTGELSGNIYVGRVMNVLPGMNAAFVDIGLEKNAFLHAGDIKLDLRSEKALAGELGELNISRIARPGQEMPVQVIREPGGSKGPRVSCHMTVPGRLIVLLPTMKYIGISRKIDDDTERKRLSGIANALMTNTGMGMIMRTAAADVSAEEINAEYDELADQWSAIDKRGRSVRAPALIYGGDTFERMIIRDWADSADSIETDSVDVYESLMQEAARTDLSSEIKLYSGIVPLFDVYRIDVDYEKALKHHVWLKSGGYLVIDHTEALTVIDVNTGKYIGKGSLEDTIYRTNQEAAAEIARQLRLRDIGGIVIIDFIDMADQDRREKLVELLIEETSRDRIQVTVEGMTRLGLVELTRKKSRLTVQKKMKHVCGICGGTGFVDDFETIAWRIVYDLRRRHMQNPQQAYKVSLSSGVAGALIAIGAPAGMKVHVENADLPDDQYHIEALDTALLSGGIKLLRTE